MTLLGCFHVFSVSAALMTYYRHQKGCDSLKVTFTCCHPVAFTLMYTISVALVFFLKCTYFLQSLPVDGEVIFYHGAELHFADALNSDSDTPEFCRGKLVRSDCVKNLWYCALVSACYRPLNFHLFILCFIISFVSSY